jgi:hypothetical protein
VGVLACARASDACVAHYAHSHRRAGEPGTDRQPRKRADPRSAFAGEAAYKYAGPAVILSFAVAGMCSIVYALSFAELAAMVMSLSMRSGSSMLGRCGW